MQERSAASLHQSNKRQIGLHWLAIQTRSLSPALVATKELALLGLVLPPLCADTDSGNCMLRKRGLTTSRPCRTPMPERGWKLKCSQYIRQHTRTRAGNARSNIREHGEHCICGITTKCRELEVNVVPLPASCSMALLVSGSLERRDMRPPLRSKVEKKNTGKLKMAYAQHARGSHGRQRHNTHRR